MKNLVFVVKAIPGTPRNQVIAESIEMAKEMNAMLEVETENVKVHVLPDTKVEQVEKHLKEKTGK